MSDKTENVTLEDVTKEFKAQTEEVKSIAEELLAKRDEGSKIGTEAKEAADKALTKLNELKAQLEEVEQKMARRQNAQEAQANKSLGERFVESDEFKSMMDRGVQRGSRASMEVKAAITSATTEADGSAGALVAPTRLPLVAGPQRRLTVRDLLMPGTMTGNSLEYPREKGFTNSAAPVAEGAKKPESSIQIELVTTSAKVIAHYMKASRQILDDAQQLASYIDGRLIYGLKLVEENQLLNGDGTGQNLFGIIPQATAYAKPTGAATTKDSGLDTLRFAMLQAILAEYPASGHVLNPMDWTNIETLKDDTGNYIIGNPQGNIQPTLWGLPVVQTQAVQAGKFLTGAFDLGAQIFDRWQSRVEIATENEDDFVKNLVTILAEERLALAVYRPESFIYGDIEPVVEP